MGGVKVRKLASETSKLTYDGEGAWTASGLENLYFALRFPRKEERKRYQKMRESNIQQTNKRSKKKKTPSIKAQKPNHCVHDALEGIIRRQQLAVEHAVAGPMLQRKANITWLGTVRTRDFHKLIADLLQLREVQTTAPCTQPALLQHREEVAGTVRRAVEPHAFDDLVLWTQGSECVIYVCV